MEKYVLVIDEGTTGTRALIFNQKLQIVAQSYDEFTQYTPGEDKVEHDALEIYPGFRVTGSAGRKNTAFPVFFLSLPSLIH